MVAQQPSDPTDEHDRDQPGALRYVARPASAAQRGGGEAAPALRRVSGSVARPIQVPRARS